MHYLFLVVLGAEIAALVWFSLFLTLARGGEREGRKLQQSPRDPDARIFLASVRLAFATAITAVSVLSLIGVL
jgi:hypothetical protein